MTLSREEWCRSRSPSQCMVERGHYGREESCICLREVSYSILHKAKDITQAAESVCAILLIESTVEYAEEFEGNYLSTWMPTG